MEVALWVWSYGRIDYEVYDSEEEAASAAAAMVDTNTAAPAGVQFPDGRLLEREEWPAYAEAERQRDAWYAEMGQRRREHQPPPQRKITAPFGGGQIKIDATEPSWLGVKP